MAREKIPRPPMAEATRQVPRGGQFQRNLAKFEGMGEASSRAVTGKDGKRLGGGIGEGRASASREVGPHRFSLFSSELETTVHARELADLQPGPRGLVDLLEQHELDDSGTWWLDLLSPTAAEMDVLSQVGLTVLLINVMLTECNRCLEYIHSQLKTSCTRRLARRSSLSATTTSSPFAPSNRTA